MNYKRQIQTKIEESLFKEMVIVLYGPRRVGKTTLAKEILAKSNVRTKYINCELDKTVAAFKVNDSEMLKNFIGDYDLVVLDEAQVIPEIGKRLKLLIDTYPKLQIIATGSSSFDLANQIGEPLTGRMRKFFIYPISAGEIIENSSKTDFMANLESRLVYGSYPRTLSMSQEDTEEYLADIVNSYLYKDILALEGLKKPRLVFDLTRALALQVGMEVSLNELGNLLKVDTQTIAKYIDLLEKCFVIFTLRPLSRNMRKEIASKNKIYFYDLGVRNSLIQNHNPINIRQDIGSLWENFCILERFKFNENNRKLSNKYFWRTYDQKELDYIEEYGGILHGYEFKWGSSRVKNQKEFKNTYPESILKVIDKTNMLDFLLQQ